MPFYNPIGSQQVCTQCGWKNPHIEHTDLRIMHYKNCPKCKGELKYQKPDVLDYFNSLLNPFKFNK